MDSLPLLPPPISRTQSVPAAASKHTLLRARWNTPTTAADRVLFVDDDELCRRSFAREMRRAGFIVDVAQSGKEALGLLQVYPYAVLAADWRMPELDGQRLAEQVQGQGIRPTCVLITGANETELELEDMRGSGISAVIRKPWHSGELTETLCRAVGEYRLRKSRDKANRSAPLHPRSQHTLLCVCSPGSEEVHRALVKVNDRSCKLHLVQDLDQALDELARTDYDAALLCLSGSARHPLGELRRLLSNHPALPVLALCSAEETALDTAAVQAGAQDCLAPEELAGDRLDRVVRRAVERTSTQQRLAYVAHHDPLTGLANRAQLEERLEQAISRARRKDRHVAVFFLDLDRFKTVNDTLGHQAGDELLQQVAERLRASVRETDTVARLGGDEFTVVLEDLVETEEATLLARRILNSFATPFRLAQAEVVSTTSIGIALHPHNGSTVDGLLKSADTAMYRAKQTGRDNYHFFSAELHANSLRQSKLECDLRRAVLQEQFSVFYQPQISNDTRRVVTVEAFARWQREAGHYLNPADFMPTLERTGLIVTLGQWILKQVCAQVRAWNDSSDLGLRGSVNISARQFESASFVEAVDEALRTQGLEGRFLELEIPEAVLAQDPDSTLDKFRRLKHLGVRITLDDFGTGTSSLAQLRALPIDALKIDRTFLSEVNEDNGEAPLATTVAGIGQSLGLEVIAEGVETPAHLRFTRRAGCQFAQGYLVGRPQAAAETTIWLRELLDHGGVWAGAPESHVAGPLATAQSA